MKVNEINNYKEYLHYNLIFAKYIATEKRKTLSFTKRLMYYNLILVEISDLLP